MLKYKKRQIIGIMACDPRGVIGKNGKLPWFYHKELEHFRNTTYGQIIIMGSKTFLDVPKDVLQNCFNIVLSQKLNKTSAPLLPSTLFIQSLQEFLSIDYLPKDKQLYVIGGAKIVRLFLENNLIEEFLLTKISKTYEGDTFFPLDLLKNWPYIKVSEYPDFTIYKYFNQYKLRGSNL